MSGLCQFIVNGRAKRGEPLLCGATGVPYLVRGGLGGVAVTLCRKHMEMMASHGYVVEAQDSKISATHPQRSTTERSSEAATRELPLFDEAQEQ